MTRYTKAVTGKKTSEDASTWSSLKQTIDTAATKPKHKKEKKKKLKESPPQSGDVKPRPANDDVKYMSVSHEDAVLKKLKKKKNKQRIVDDAIKSEAEAAAKTNTAPPAYKQPAKLGKGNQRFSTMEPAAKRESRADVHKNRRGAMNPCYVCRSTRHKASDCPKGSEKGVGMCFKCASTQHTSATCNRRDIEGFPHAKCFICNETGHLSKMCPDNPRGLYPNGGCCKECGAVEHFAKDCPGKLKQQQSRTIKLKSMASAKCNVEDNNMMDFAEEEEFVEVKKSKPQPHRPKVVKF